MASDESQMWAAMAEDPQYPISNEDLFTQHGIYEDTHGIFMQSSWPAVERGFYAKYCIHSLPKNECQHCGPHCGCSGPRGGKIVKTECGQCMLNKANSHKTWTEYRLMWKDAVDCFIRADTESALSRKNRNYLKCKLKRLLWQTERAFDMPIEQIMQLQNMQFLQNTLYAPSNLIDRARDYSFVY